MNTGTAISTAVLTGLVAGELHEVATPPGKQPSLHAPGDPAHNAGPHLEYQGFRAQFVTVPLTPLHMVATLGHVEAINQPQSVIFAAATQRSASLKAEVSAPLLAAQKEQPA
jgi:hypothetical protein